MQPIGPESEALLDRRVEQRGGDASPAERGIDEEHVDEPVGIDVDDPDDDAPLSATNVLRRPRAPAHASGSAPAHAATCPAS